MYLGIINIALKQAMDKVEDNVGQEVIDQYLKYQHRNFRAELVYMASQLQSILRSHDVYGASLHIPSPTDNDEWIRELEVIGAEV